MVDPELATGCWKTNPHADDPEVRAKLLEVEANSTYCWPDCRVTPPVLKVSATNPLVGFSVTNGPCQSELPVAPVPFQA